MTIEFIEMIVMPEVLALPLVVAYAPAIADDGADIHVLAIQVFIFNFAWEVRE